MTGSNLGWSRRRMGQARRPGFSPNKWLAAVRCFAQYRAVIAYVTRRSAKASFERTIEIGQIAKTHVICDRPDRVLRQPRLGQHAVGTAQTLRQQELRERRVFAFKKPLQIARREPEMRRDHSDRKLAPAAVFGDVRFCHA